MSHRFAAYASLVLWVIVIVGSIFLWATDSLESLPIEVVYKEVCDENAKECSKNPDVINIAVQLGRLDWVATALAILGAGIGLLAIFSLLFTKEKAEIEARSTAREVSEQQVNELIKDYKDSIQDRIDKKLAEGWLQMEQQMRVYQELLGATDISAEDSDEIAKSMEDDV